MPPPATLDNADAGGWFVREADMTPEDLERILATAQSGSSVLARGLAVLQIVREGGSLQVREIAEAAGIPVATTYRLVRQLEASGFLVEHDGRLHPGGQLTGMRDEARHLVDYASPVLSALAAETGLSAILTVRVHHLALTLHGVAGRRARRAAFVVGQTHGLHAGASATPLLASAPQAVIDAVLAGRPRRYTTLTPTVEELPEKLARIRARGYDSSRGEIQPEWAAVGLPVVIDDTPVCCLSLAAPIHVMDEQAALAALRTGVRHLIESVPTTVGPSLWEPTQVPEGDLS